MRASIRRGFGVLFIAALMPASWAFARQSGAAQDEAGWIDAPRDGASVDLGQVVTIVAHVADVAGVAGADVIVDGVVVESIVADSGSTLETIRTTWPATEAGHHSIVVAPTGTSGRWAQVSIVVVDGATSSASSTTTTTTTTTISTTTSTTISTTATTATPTPTTVPATTATTTTKPPTTTTTAAPPSTTSTTTTTVCTLAAPELVSPADDATVTPILTLSWAYSGCALPTSYEVQVSTNPAFFETVASAITADTSWGPPVLACDTYHWRVRTIVAGSTVITGPWSSTRSFIVSTRGC